MHQIQYSGHVRSAEIPKLDPSVRAKIVQAIESKLMVAPEIFGKPLRHTLRLLRVLRVGDWRIVFIIEQSIVHILTIRHRKQGYADLT